MKKYQDRHGYIRLAGGQSEHRYVMEQVLGRPLKRSEHVHHKNRDRADNRPENLEIICQAEHNKLHGQMKRHGQCPENPTTTLKILPKFPRDNSHGLKVSRTYWLKRGLELQVAKNG